ncbi:MAG: O-antigen ligase family protein [Bacteroidales bacterium]|nr:O-antigen ligase family protein [Bacteroidales bacterium]
MSKRLLYLYYFFLLVVLCTWFNTTSAPPMPLRLIYLAALVFPVFLKAPNNLVPIINCFTALGTYGFSRSYMPTEKWIYLLIIVICLFLGYSKLKRFQRPPSLMILFCVYIWSIDIIQGTKIVDIDYTILIVLLSFFFVSKDGSEKNSYILAFMIITLILGLFFLTYGQSSAISVSETGRRSWVDPNYFGNVCGMGVVLAYNTIVNKLSQNLYFKRIAILTIALGLLTLVMNASRGAFLSASVSIVIITFFSKVSIKTKVGIAVLVSIGVVAMFSMGAFDVLANRFMDQDDTTGNGRTLIWEAKLLGYIGLPTHEKLFGIGYDGGFSLAIPGGYGFHNDFLAFLVDYGLVGLLFFLALMLYPIIIVGKNSSARPIVISLVLFLLTCCSTLEPLTAGKLPYWYYYFFIVLFARWSKSRQR